MATKIRLLALDMDGTTLNEDKEISSENRQWIQRALDAGVMVMFATGRPLQEVLSYKEELGLQTPMVLLNGSEVWSQTGECIERHFLNHDDLIELHHLAVKYGTWFWGYTMDGQVNKNTFKDEFLANEWMKFGIHSHDRGIIQEIRELIKGWNRLEVTSSNLNNIEINPKGVTKASGVKVIGKLFGIDMDQVMAIGDSLNDAPLVAEAGLGIAMGNAEDALKQIADGITESNEKDGVAKAIEKYLF